MKKLTIKKLTALALAALTALSLAGCGGETPTTAVPASTPAQTQPIVITTAEESTPAETTAPETTAPAPETTEEPTTEPENTEPVEPFGEEDLVLIVDGVELSLRMDFVPVKDTILGGDYDEQVGQACVGGGNDRDYFYGENFEVHTVGNADGQQLIYDIYITLMDGYATQKGAVIGRTTRDEVLEIYGEPYSSFPASERYSVDGKLELIFGFDGEILSSVGLHDNETQ